MSPKIHQIRGAKPKAAASGREKPPRPFPEEEAPRARDAYQGLPKSGIRDAIALLELTSIAKGIEATDLMLKAAAVQLLASRSICSGKYMVLVRGDVAACTASLRAGEEVGRETVADAILIPRLHEEIFPAIAQAAMIDEVEALGVLESFNVATLIEAADAAVKSAQVHLLEIRLAMALGGKAFCVLTGQVAAVRSAVETGKIVLAEKGCLTSWAVIPSPKAELVKELLGGRIL